MRNLYRELIENGFGHNVERFITVRGQYEGFHRYENAPEQVAFLRESHRHIFKWKVMIDVRHDDRELEFFMVKDLLEREVISHLCVTSNLGSCEMQAERILEGLVNTYGPTRNYIVTVSEDGENDGSVEWTALD